jgi:hypothetical protein
MVSDIIGQVANGMFSRRESLLGFGATSAIAPTLTSSTMIAPERNAVSQEHLISLSQFGFVGDGSHDDTQAWRDAIAAAERLNIRIIAVPWGVNGTSLVKQSICDGPLPSGLTFEGEARRHANPDQTGQRVVYTGSETCWSIRPGTASPTTIGQWTWRHLMFEATHPDGTMFDFNAGEQTILRDGTAGGYIIFVAFESCYLKGAGAGKRQTGDGIRAAKTFSLLVDKQCQVRDWRRGVWLRGCDDCTIEGRIWLNARSIVHERSGTFGSNLQITSNWLGRCPDETSEPAYILWDNGSGTAIHGTFFEGHDHGGKRQNERALVRLDGFGSTLIGCRFAEGHCLEIAPGAREVTLVAPGFAAHRPENDAIISLPESWDFGFQQEDFRVLVIGASKNAVKHLGSHPRLIYRGRLPMTYDAVGGNVPVDMEADMVADGNGYRPRRRLLTAFNLFAKNDSTIVNGGARLVPAPQSSQGWAINCEAALPQAGISAAFIVGRDVQIGDRLRIAIRAACPSQGWHLRIFRGDADVTPTPLPLGGAPGFLWQAMTINLGDWRLGDRLSVVVLKISQPSQDLLIDFVEFATVSVIEAPPSPGDVQPGSGTDVASCRSVNAVIASLTARIDALQQALRRAGDIA